MNAKIIKKDGMTIAYVPNVKDMVELGGLRIRIIGYKTCECCGHHDEPVIYDAAREDRIEIKSTLD
jgi:hypothetical protein